MLRAPVRPVGQPLVVMPETPWSPEVPLAHEVQPVQLEFAPLLFVKPRALLSQALQLRSVWLPPMSSPPSLNPLPSEFDPVNDPLRALRYAQQFSSVTVPSHA